MAADATPAVSSLKEQGNASLKQGDLKSACAFYTEALAEALPADEAAAVHCNRALARLKLKETAACIADCSLAIGFQPGYAKAFYRRAQAYEASQKLADAFKDLREVLRLESANREAQQFAARLKQAIEMRNATADLSTPSLAVETLRAVRGPVGGSVPRRPRRGSPRRRASQRMLHAVGACMCRFFR